MAPALQYCRCQPVGTLKRKIRKKHSSEIDSAVGFTRFAQSGADSVQKKNPERCITYQMRKSERALLTQMRTEKIRLKKFLHTRKVPDFESPHRECGRGLQTARHILTICPKFIRLRRQKLKAYGKNMPFGAIGGREMLTRPAYAKIAVNSMRVTRLPNQFKSIDMMPERNSNI